MSSNRTPYVPVHVFHGAFVLPELRRTMNEIEVQFARILVRFLERPENAEFKAYIIACAWEHYNDHSASIPLFVRHIQNMQTLSDMMDIPNILQPDDDPLLYGVAYTKMTSFYMFDGNFNAPR